MKNRNKYCETLKLGFYLGEDRCIYASGYETGNRWIYLNSVDPEWTDMEHEFMEPGEIKRMTYHFENPTPYPDVVRIEDQRDDVIGVLENIEAILASGGTITSKSVIRGAVLLALGKDPYEVMRKERREKILQEETY